MADEDVAAILDRAVATARAAGHPVSGWTMQSSDDGYVAWLYVEDDESQQPLFDDVDLLPSAEAAARWCLMRAEGQEPGEPSDDADDADDGMDA